MAAEIVFEDREMRKWLEGLVKKTKNPEKQKNVLAAFSAIIYRDVMDHFSKEEGPEGAWEAWSTTYALHMARIGRSGNKLLQFTGRMRQNFTPTKVKTSSLAITWYNNAKTSGGFPYAWAHDEGTGKLPQREFMWASQKAMDEIASIVWNELMEDT